MSDHSSHTRQDQVDAFERQADLAAPGLVGETIGFLRHNKKWWLAPLLIVLALVGLLVLAQGSVLAPFIYTLF
jgi:F0F1-type ATP synthase assembly protein I